MGPSFFCLYFEANLLEFRATEVSSCYTFHMQMFFFFLACSFYNCDVFSVLTFQNLNILYAGFVLITR